MEIDPVAPKSKEEQPILMTSTGKIRRRDRWRLFMVYGLRCRWCLQGILWIRQHEGRQIAIEPRSWNGEQWYLKGVHRWHGFKCEGMRYSKRAAKTIRPEDLAAIEAIAITR